MSAPGSTSHGNGRATSAAGRSASRGTRTRRTGRPPGVDGQVTRARILHSAREVFSTTGFDRATMDEIARDVGITRNAINRYYPTKVALHQAAFNSIEAEALAHNFKALPEPDATVVDRILAVFGDPDRDQDLTVVRFWVTATLDAVHHPELRAQSERLLVSVREHFETVLSEARARDEVDAAVDPVVTARLLTDLLWGVAMDRGFRASPKNFRTALDMLRVLVTNALAPGDIRSRRP